MCFVASNEKLWKELKMCRSIQEKKNLIQQIENCSTCAKRPGECSCTFKREMAVKNMLYHFYKFDPLLQHNK